MPDPKTPEEFLKRIAECVGRTEEELADENYDWDRETAIGVIHDVRLHLHEAGIEIPEV